MLSDKYKKILLFVFLASCSATGYKPSYIITDQPLSEEAKTGNKKLKEPLRDPIR